MVPTSILATVLKRISKFWGLQRRMIVSPIFCQLDQDVPDTSLAVIAVVYDVQGVYSC